MTSYMGDGPDIEATFGEDAVKLEDRWYEGVDPRVDADIAVLFATPQGPVERIVCTECDGVGSHGPGWTWTMDDIAQEDPEEFAELQRELRAGRYDKPCEMCKGQRVITMEDLQDAKYRYEDMMTRRAESGYTDY